MSILHFANFSGYRSSIANLWSLAEIYSLTFQPCFLVILQKMLQIFQGNRPQQHNMYTVTFKHWRRLGTKGRCIDGILCKASSTITTILLSVSSNQTVTKCVTNCLFVFFGFRTIAPNVLPHSTPLVKQYYSSIIIFNLCYYLVIT